MNEHDDRHDPGDEPRWLRLAADLRAEPAPGTLAWVRWLGRPAALATSVALLVVCAWAGNAWLASTVGTRTDSATLVSALLDEDGSFGLGVQSDEPVSPSGADSGAVAR